MNHPIDDWEGAYRRRLLEEVRVMEDALGKGLDEARNLFDDYFRLRRETPYVRPEFRLLLERYGIDRDQAQSLSARLDDWFDDFHKEVARAIAARARP